MTPDPILGGAETIMPLVRDDCSAWGAEGVVDQLLAIADHRLGACALAEAAALEIIRAAPGRCGTPRRRGRNRGLLSRNSWMWMEIERESMSAME